LEDELLLQFVPYVLLFGPNRTVFSYTRASNISEYGEPRLFAKKALGISGHIAKGHSPNYLDNCLKRKVYVQ